ncbi:Metallo-dependent phosphatase-like protein [Pavlovales sp. CCMP2436]|nr:Metallo-dependent phosphatase-like protein [Pavlovales sp. CCMP2436]
MAGEAASPARTLWLAILAGQWVAGAIGAGSPTPALRTALELKLPCRTAGQPGGERRTIYAVGDVHGDAEALRRLLAAAGVTDASGLWNAGDSVLVQSGDLLDRHSDDLAPVRLLRRLRRGARERGGEVAWILGNHEIMNAVGDMRYVPSDGYEVYDRLMRRWSSAQIDAALGASADRVPARERARLAALMPGGLVARAIAAPMALIVGDSLFCHGGVRASHLPYLADWSREAEAWLRGDGPMPANALTGVDSPIWSRKLSSSPPGEEPPASACAELGLVLSATGCARIVVGHTPQPYGANGACDGRVWRVDTGMSLMYGGPAELLRIDGATGEVSVCSLPRGSDEAVWLCAEETCAVPRYAPLQDMLDVAPARPL